MEKKTIRDPSESHAGSASSARFSVTRTPYKWNTALLPSLHTTDTAFGHQSRVESELACYGCGYLLKGLSS
ncbi:MAG: hypothetical protein R3253_14780, partial [Longimicrobiales bacterium]|nr:hypothetical protein [Longimicrobiales bacterium]